MNTKSYEFVLETGFAGSVHRDIIELPFDFTEEEIEDEFQSWKGNLIEGSWREIEDGSWRRF